MAQDSLFFRVNSIVREFSLFCLPKTAYHLQVTDSMGPRKTILINIWPTKCKALDWWPKSKTTVTYINDDTLCAHVRQVCEEYVKVHGQKPVLPDTAPRPKWKPKPEPRQRVLPGIVDEPPTIRRTAVVDLVPDGDDLRVLITSMTHAESFRVNAADSLVLLQKAAKLLDKRRTGSDEEEQWWV